MMRQFFCFTAIVFGVACGFTINPACAATGAGSLSVYDLSVLPAFSGIVSQYIPSPSGGVTGILLDNGTEVLVSPDVAWSLPKIVKPGEKVTGTGLRGKTLPLIRAFAISGPHGRSAEDTGITMPQHSPEMITGPDIVVHGPVWVRLYDIQGTLCGVVLKDHTVVKIPPGAAARIASWLTPGAIIFAAGPGTSGELGVSINAHEIGPDSQKLISLAAEDAPPPGPPPGSPGYDIISAAEAH
ncbi:hypothetical protein GOB93_15170 [Acetobacter musti]|uniref:Uncharacterized protein n=1 Tax=Acetobacter musti TaxID=864732 RepID=A0ABX0JTX6_9PROT|nr:hypothetical protein [Acetobacter musti]NHN85971.1 hypothetical protein [Acetobacter musti]